MTAKPNKTPCSIPGCRAWAMRGSDPPLCSPHSGRAGASAGNQNVRRQSFYSPMIAAHDLADLVDCEGEITLDDEIACTRVVLRGLLEQLRNLPTDADPVDYARAAGLALAAARTIARLLRDKRAIDGAAADGIAAAIAQGLDEIVTQWGVVP